MKLRRFIWVAGPRSVVRHILFGPKVEGKAACGTIVRKGWLWWTAVRSHKLPICSSCTRSRS